MACRSACMIRRFTFLYLHYLIAFLVYISFFIPPPFFKALIMMGMHVDRGDRRPRGWVGLRVVAPLVHLGGFCTLGGRFEYRMGIGVV